MQFQCLVANPQSGIAVLFYMVKSHQRATLCLKVARQLTQDLFGQWFSGGYACSQKLVQPCKSGWSISP